MRRSPTAASAGLAGRRRRRQFDARLRDGRGQAPHPARPSRGRPAQRATGRCRRRSTGSSPMLSPTCSGRPRPMPTQPARRGRDSGGGSAGSATSCSTASSCVRPAIEAAGAPARNGLAPAGLWRRDPAPPVECRRPGGARASRRGARAGAGAAAARLPRPSAHRCAARRLGPRRPSCGGRGAADRAAPLCRAS